jgi:WD40 repeat protein
VFAAGRVAAAGVISAQVAALAEGVLKAMLLSKLKIVTTVVLADGKRALSASHDQTVRLWDLETGKELKRFFGHTNHVWPVAISRDGRYALSGSLDKTMRLWQLRR